MSMFEIATRKKYRFDSPKGLLTTEDLWDLPLTALAGRANLDDIARGLHKRLKSGEDVSFVVAEKKSDETIQAQFDIVRHIIDVRLAENRAIAEQRANAEKKQVYLSILADKENEALKNLTADELRAMVAAM